MKATDPKLAQNEEIVDVTSRPWNYQIGQQIPCYRLNCEHEPATGHYTVTQIRRVERERDGRRWIGTRGSWRTAMAAQKGQYDIIGVMTAY